MRSFSRFAPFGLILVVCLAPMFARAADVSITCAAPTQFTDGTPIPAGTAFTFHLYSGSTGLDTQTACQFTRKNLAANTYNYSVTATVAGIESDKSEIVQVVVPSVVPALKPAPPGTPVATVVTTSQTVYTTVRTKGRYVAVAIGTVPLGASCDVTQQVLGLYALSDPAQATFTGTTKTIAPLASCT